MPGFLESAKHQQWNEVTGMERGARRIESAVERDWLLSSFTQGVKVSGLINQSTPAEFINNVRVCWRSGVVRHWENINFL